MDSVKATQSESEVVAEIQIDGDTSVTSNVPSCQSTGVNGDQSKQLEDANSTDEPNAVAETDVTAAAANSAAVQNDPIEKNGNVAPVDEIILSVAKRPTTPTNPPLPTGWKEIYHESGATIYVHLETNTCSLTRPYYLNGESILSHSLPISSIPCLNYRRSQQNNEMKATSVDATNDLEKIKSEPVAENSNADTAAKVSSTTTAELQQKEIIDYCKRLFQWQNIRYFKFKSSETRSAFIASWNKEQIRRKYPLTPNSTTLPAQTDNEAVYVSNQNSTVNRERPTYVTILDAYMFRSKKAYPEYKCSQLESGKESYLATVFCNGIKYGLGAGKSNDEAKIEAAKATLQLLLPKLMKYVLKTNCENYDKSANDDNVKNLETQEEEEKKPVLDMNAVTMLDNISINGARVIELSKELSLPSPFEVLLVYLEKKTSTLLEVKYEFEAKAHICTLSVGVKNKTTVRCEDGQRGKQLAAQGVLKQYHQEFHNWGTILRFYKRWLMEPSAEENFKPEMKKLRKYLKRRIAVLVDGNKLMT